MVERCEEDNESDPTDNKPKISPSMKMAASQAQSGVNLIEIRWIDDFD